MTESRTWTFSPGRCQIIGEVAQAHDGSLGMAHAFIDAIANAGADAVKFQTHIAAAESTPQEPWRVRFSEQDESRWHYWKRMEFTEPQWRSLKDHARARGLAFVSSPFSPEAVDLLRRVGVDVWKIASGEVTDSSVLDPIAESGWPVLVSTGMSPLDEIDRAVDILRSHGLSFGVLQCTSMYPCPPEKVGLNMLEELRARYACPIGLSDHSGKVYAGLAAAALGVEVLEVHVTLSRDMFGPDVSSSLTTEEFRQLVSGVRDIECMRSHPVDKDQVASDLASLRSLFTKSIVARVDLEAGTELRREHLALKKPGTGLSPDKLPGILGRRLTRSLRRDQMLVEADFT